MIMKRIIFFILTAFFFVNVSAEISNEDQNENENCKNAIDMVKVVNEGIKNDSSELNVINCNQKNAVFSEDGKMNSKSTKGLDSDKSNSQNFKHNLYNTNFSDSLHNVEYKLNNTLNKSEAPNSDSNLEQLRLAHKNKLDKWKVVGLYSAAIILNGIGDGLNNTNSKTMGHIFNAASIGVLLSTPFLINYNKNKWYWYVLTYTSLRVTLFDAAYNVTTKQPINFIGSTAITDKIYKKLEIYGVPKAMGLAVGLTIPLRLL